MEGARGEAVPAFVACEEVDVEEEEDGEEVIGYCNGDGSADETPVEFL